MHHRYSDLIDADSGLTALGWQQTRALADWLGSHYTIDRVVTAPQLRNRLTAQRIGQTLGLPVTIQASFGRFADLNAIHATHNQLNGFSSLQRDLGMQKLYEELLRLFEASDETSSIEIVAVVMDAAAISATIAYLCGAECGRFVIDYTSLSELVRQNDGWLVAAVNRREHLPAPPLPDRSVPDSVVSGTDLEEDIAPVAAIYDSQQDNASPTSLQERRRRIQDLLDFAQISAEASVLDVGTGTGMLALMLAEAGTAEVIGVDVSPALLERAEYLRLSTSADVAKRVDFRLAAAQALPFRNERFDYVVCRMVLHHWRRPERILRELVRVLKPEGILVIADLLSNEDPVKRATQNAIEERRNPTHVAARSAREYRNLVSSVGLHPTAEREATFGRELEDWLSELSVDGSNRAVVREMIEAGLETDASGMKARRQGNSLLFEQRIFYIRATKEA